MTCVEGGGIVGTKPLKSWGSCAMMLVQCGSECLRGHDLFLEGYTVQDTLRKSEHVVKV